MTASEAELRAAMEAAAAREDYEEAGRLRNLISLLRGGGEVETVDPSGLERQQAGRMGLGSSRQRVTPPPGWVPPKKPDPMTRGRSRKGPRG